MDKFSTRITWDSAQGANERHWVEKIMELIHERSIMLPEYSRHLKVLRKEMGEAPSFMVSVGDTAFEIYNKEDRGSTDQAVLFIAAFLERWRPQLAVRLPWESFTIVQTADSAETRIERMSHGTLLIGPKGIQSVRGLMRGTKQSLKKRA